jgi:hypothetical protein
MLTEIYNIYFHKLIAPIRAAVDFCRDYLSFYDWMAIFFIFGFFILPFIIFCSIRVDNMFSEQKQENNKLRLLVSWEKYRKTACRNDWYVMNFWEYEKAVA